jgi:hypothetical protein
MRYSYFFSYSTPDKMGMAEFELSKKIDSIADLFAVKAMIDNNLGVKTVVIISFQLLREIKD